jgi:hypothetical protein
MTEFVHQRYELDRSAMAAIDVDAVLIGLFVIGRAPNHTNDSGVAVSGINPTNIDVLPLQERFKCS